MNKERVSVVVPTMWRSMNKLVRMLGEYEDCGLVSEVVLIDNDPSRTPDLAPFKKINYLTKGENIYVNPAWNWGAEAAENETLLLANDDVYVRGLSFVLAAMLSSGYGIVGMDVSRPTGTLRVDPIDSFPANSYGCFMLVRKYARIPDSLLIWYGDNVLFEAAASRGIVRNTGIEAGKSETIESDARFFRQKIGRSDIAAWDRICRRGKRGRSSIAVCIPMYRKHRIANFVLGHYMGLKNRLKDKIELILICAGSEGDASRTVAELNDFVYVECANEPLSQKHNALYVKAREYSPDACIKIDSDSILTEEFFLWYDDLINEGVDYAGIEDVYFLFKKRAYYWAGYSGSRRGEPTGVGRFMSRRLLEMLGWTPWGGLNVNDAFDINMTRRIDALGNAVVRRTVKCGDVGGLCIDIKSDVNISPLHLFEFESAVDAAEFGIDFSYLEPVLLDWEPEKKNKALVETGTVSKRRNGIEPHWLNVVIRTSGRPKYFYRCVSSIREIAPGATLHVILDDQADLAYVRKLAHGFDCRYYIVDGEEVQRICDGIRVTRKPFKYNWYFNVVKPMLDGWCMFLDDDDKLRSEPENPGSDTKKMFLYKVNIAGRVVPNDQNFGGKPVLNDISGLSVVFHSSEMVNWKPQRGGDYDFISEMYGKCHAVWVNRILSATQTSGNNGNRKDLD